MTLFWQPTEAKADTIVLNAFQQGFYRNDGLNNGVFGTPNNYFVGYTNGGVYRNYFAFELASVRDVTSAQLRIYRPGDSDLDTDAFETYVLYDVLTPPELLGHVGGVSIFDDLGSGTVYASENVPTPNFFDGGYMTINLNADAIAALQGGQLFAIGGAITTLRFPAPIGSEGLFGGSQGIYAQLILEGRRVEVPIPEPATLLLLGSGLAGVGTRIRKRRRASQG
jgi:hypothetical protein